MSRRPFVAGSDRGGRRGRREIDTRVPFFSLRCRFVLTEDIVVGFCCPICCFIRDMRWIPPGEAARYQLQLGSIVGAQLAGECPRWQGLGPSPGAGAKPAATSSWSVLVAGLVSAHDKHDSMARPLRVPDRPAAPRSMGGLRTSDSESGESQPMPVAGLPGRGARGPPGPGPSVDSGWAVAALSGPRCEWGPAGGPCARGDMTR
jgi:hypothetical protein